MAAYESEIRCNGSHGLEMPETAVEILSGLYLGNQICSLNAQALSAEGIKYILTLGKNMLPQFEEMFEYKVLELDDGVGVDLLSHLDDIRRWLDARLDGGGKVLVHDESGTNLAPAAAVAYVMSMKKMEYVDAFKLVHGKYKPAERMNLTLIHQLKTYASLKFEVDGDSPEHLKSRMDRLTCAMLEKHFLPASMLAKTPSCTEPVKNQPVDANEKEGSADPAKKPTLAEINKAFGGKGDRMLYRCSGCSQALFEAPKNRFPVDHSDTLQAMGGGECMFHWIEPMQWMGDIETSEGWLFCPQCKSVVGQFNWYGMEDCCMLGSSDPSFGIQKFAVIGTKLEESIEKKNI